MVVSVINSLQYEGYLTQVVRKVVKYFIIVSITSKYKKSVIVHQSTEVLPVTVVVVVHHGGLDNIEPGPDGVRNDILQDHHEDSSSRDLVTNKLPGPAR